MAVALAGLLIATLGAAEKRFALTIDNIMRGPGLVGYPPSAVRWSGDSQRIYFDWKQPDDPHDKPFDTYVVSRDGTGLRKLSETEAKLAPPANGDSTKDRRLTAYALEGDIFVYEHPTATRRQITSTEDVESNPRFLLDGQRIAFTRSGNLYVISIQNGSLVEMTDIRSDGSEQAGRRSPTEAVSDEDRKKDTESQEYIRKEERQLIGAVAERAKRREEEQALRKREHPRKPFHLSARESVVSLQLSPDEKTVLALISEKGEGAKTTIVPNFVTESAYTEDIPSRTKVGDIQPHMRLALIGVESGEVKWADAGQKDRLVQFSQPVWSNDGTKAVLLARAADNKDRWVLALDAATGKTRVLIDLHDDAWVDGPGADTLGWMKSDHAVYFQSERDGYSHLYTVSYDGGEPRQLTSGKWEVTRTELSADKTRFYLTTSEASPFEQQFYVMNAGGSERTLLTSMPGSHQVTLSPDEKWMADVYSFTNKPPELYAGENRARASEVKLTSSPSPEFWEYSWEDPPIVQIQTRDGAMLPARFYKPRNFSRSGPAVIFVHGAGYLQDVDRWWSAHYYREYMFHHFLMEHGYLVLEVDYRGSAGYGRDWRTAIYKHMGGKDLDDQVDAAHWLVAAHGVNPKRIGIYGGSYGGFVTLMAMFTQPDVFAAGAALRPVTDWAHYNNGYTSNILNLPQKDSGAYKLSSPIYFAQGLKGALLICHGMVDTNVHFEDTVRLVERLIELRKQNWELAVFPVEDHEFQEPASWADEYKRIFRLFEMNLNGVR